jgi:stage II sporulation protein AB (anti-sigma F factor)
MDNKMKLSFLSISENEAFARNVVASFILPLNPTLSQISDVKTAVSEAVTNAIVHGYPDSVGEIELEAYTDSDELHIIITDGGVGIDDLSKAFEPFYSSKPESERSGMGFTIMQAFMDSVEVTSKLNVGTSVKMAKKLTQKHAE